MHIDILSNYTKCLVTLNLIGSNSSSAYRSGSFLAWKLIKAILTNLFTKTLYISNIELYLANF
ncbi:hypothetical protein BB964_09540 [Campylobacter jejuni]|nr:hypothetical protein C9J79_09720 [Campylobacter jejuni]EAH7777448.1 hypothetical protein [Campylobacter coli]EAH6880380.1 hypothetical protein [Campylobacter jejuni]EAH6880474.1 hypothetical protein [Campylobacter jejuni]EAH7530750.1 hypothetical protein [Campylobacter jejuni]